MNDKGGFHLDYKPKYDNMKMITVHRTMVLDSVPQPSGCVVGNEGKRTQIKKRLDNVPEHWCV